MPAQRPSGNEGHRGNTHIRHNKQDARLRTAGGRGGEADGFAEAGRGIGIMNEAGDKHGGRVL